MILVTYLLLILVTFAIGFGAQGYVNHQLNKYSHVPNTSQMTGRDVAVGMLNYYGIQGVEVRMGREGQDFFITRSRSVLIRTTVVRSRRPQLLVMRWGMRVSSRKITSL